MRSRVGSEKARNIVSTGDCIFFTAISVYANIVTQNSEIKFEFHDWGEYNPGMNGYSIGQLAKAAGVPTSTLRYYERSGLLRPDFRTDGNYRGYAPKALERLKFIRSTQASGFSLQEVEQLLKLSYSPKPPCAEVLALMRGRLTELREKIRELRHVEKALAKSLDECCKGKGPDLCDEIRRLKGKQPGVRKPQKINSALRA